MIRKVKIKSVKKVKNFDNEYVYDIGMKNDIKMFFANNILVHNSIYFSVYETDPVKYAQMEKEGKWSKEIALEVHDKISEDVNETFPEFMNQRFNSGIVNGAIIRAGRENMADNALFIKKKRYAMNLYEDDGVRKDRDGGTGDLKIMGLEIKRSDTSKIVQDVLEKGLKMLLTGSTKEEIMEYFFLQKEVLIKKEPWCLGSPKSGNAVKFYTKQEELYKEGKLIDKPRIPGHIRACMVWNDAVNIFQDMDTGEIGDGTKITVCPLKKNQYDYKDIAYPSDMENIPDWFKKLPFDRPAMVGKNYLRKIDNIFGILEWPLHAIARDRATFEAEIYPERFNDDDFW